MSGYLMLWTLSRITKVYYDQNPIRWLNIVR